MQSVNVLALFKSQTLHASPFFCWNLVPWINIRAFFHHLKYFELDHCCNIEHD